MPTSKIASFCVLLLVLFCTQAYGAEKPQTRYLRAVYVMRKLDPSLAAGSPPSIPRRIVLDDTTNTWVKHPDTAFVLNTLARELTDLAQNERISDADYYAAHALYKLGRKKDAAAAMRRYMITARYREADYLFLVRCLYETALYTEMHETAREWWALDPRCNGQRTAYEWGARMAVNDFLLAREALRMSACSDWKIDVLAARTEAAAGAEERAEELVADLKTRHPDRSAAIDALWQDIRYAERYP